MNNILFTRKSGERRNSNLPKVIAALICNFENKNEEQKIYCLKLRDNIKYPGNIGYEIKSVTNEPFSIQLAFGGKIYTLQNEKKFTDDMLMSTLSKFYKLLRPVKPIIKK